MFFSVAFSPSLNTVSGPFGQMSFSFVVTLLELSRGFAAARRSVFFCVCVCLLLLYVRFAVLVRGSTVGIACARRVRA